MVEQTISARVFIFIQSKCYTIQNGPIKGLVEFCLILICVSVLGKINGSSTFAPSTFAPYLFFSRYVGKMNVSSSDSIISSALY